MTVTVLWFRRDLRLADNPALVAAARRAGETGSVVPLFCLDDRLVQPAGDNRLAFMFGCLEALDTSIGGSLVVRKGRPETVVPAVANQVGASAVFVAEDFGPYGRRRDRAVEEALAEQGTDLVRVGSPYAVPPGEVRNTSGRPYRVFTPFSGAWSAHGWPTPVAATPVRWISGLSGDGVPASSPVSHLPVPGEDAAQQAADRFVGEDLERYGELRDRPDLRGTSQLSPYLRWGCIHPRQLLARLGSGRSDTAFRNELCWREFFADVLWHRPETATRPCDGKMARLEVDEGPDVDELFRAWVDGRTGYPMVDAGMRQLRSEGWMHNRLRMIVASFLVKDLHVDWRRGARHFMRLLVDGDLASNQHGWQWVAGTGTDSAPFFRIFNPVTQGERFDPQGDFVRHWVPELRAVSGKAVHQPWKVPSDLVADYPAPIVDHAEERAEALRRYDQVRAGGPQA